MFKLSEAAEKSLRDAGWTPNRSIDISLYETYFLNNNYVLNDTIRFYLKNFGELILDIPSFGCDTIRDTAHFNAIEAEQSISRHNVTILERYAKESLVPVGEVYGNYITIMMSLSGKVYGAYSEFWQFGEDMYDYIAGLYQRRKGKKIHVPEMENIKQ